MSAFRVEFPPADAAAAAGAGARAPGLVAHLVMDDPDRAVNVLDERALEDLEQALARLEDRPDLGGLVVRSGKPGSFASGSGLDAIRLGAGRDRVLADVQRAQQILVRLATLPFPTVAAIDGICLGGGAELALACDSRVAADEPRTRIGLPEVLLGAMPVAGGVTRLARLVGLSTALDLVLRGRALDARAAERAGLVARAVPAAWLLEHAHRRLAELSSRAGRRRPWRDRWRARGLRSWLADGTAAGRALSFSRAAAATKVRTGGHEPAPVAVLDVLRHGLDRPVDGPLPVEAEWLADLLTGPACGNMLRAFRLAERAGVGATPPASTVERLHLAGAGATAAVIAELASRGGIEVRWRDTDPATLARALCAVRARIVERARRSGAGRHEVEGQWARLMPGLDLSGLRRADLAIEAVAEDLDVKRRVFGELEVRMRPEALLATSTAVLSVADLAAGLQHPERFVGLCFHGPGPGLARCPGGPLIEVVRGAKTAETTVAAAATLARRLGFVPVVVSDGPGFVVHRVRMSGLREALYLIEEGFGVADVDAALRSFGLPAGPFEIMDDLGLEAVRATAAALSRAFPERAVPLGTLETLIGAGRPGRQGGAGFYRYARGRRESDPRVARLLHPARRRRPPNHDILAERVILAMVNEAAYCLVEEVVADAGLLDLALMHGAGFPRFRGGPLRHADALGPGRVAARLTALRAERGERFRPAPLVTELAERGGTFTEGDGV